jgi:hypothetical protein
VLFVAIFCVILTMYGGGFATIPAYLADLFGVTYVGAIHGRLLTAWSTAGILGPVLVNYIREYQLGRGVPPTDAYTFTMYVLVAFLAIGLVCNLLVRPVHPDLFTINSQLPAPASTGPHLPAPVDVRPGRWGEVVVAWMLVGVPLAWGVYRTLALASQLFAR